MKKSLFGLIVLFILLSTYTPKFDLIKNLQLNIKKIEIENNSILDQNEIKKNLSFLYEENLFFLNVSKIENYLKNESFIESFSIKKVYPNTIKLVLIEKNLIAILQNKSNKFYISDKGDIIEFKFIDSFLDLPTVFGNGDHFFSLYLNLLKLEFPMNMIKAYYYFESGRWDLIMIDDKIIKLPIKEYLSSLKNFMSSKNDKNFNKYKIYDYRINNQIILN